MNGQKNKNRRIICRIIQTYWKKNKQGEMHTYSVD